MTTTPAGSLLAEPRPPGPPRRVWRDWALILTLVPLAILEVEVREDIGWAPVRLGLSIALTFALLWRRTAPLVVVAIVFATLAAFSVATLVGLPGPTALYTLVWVLMLPYALFRWGSGREAAIGSAIMLVSAALGIAVDAPSVSEIVLGIGLLMLPAALGASVRYRATARIREVEEAKLHERELLARELHDTVAHHVSAIAIQAQAGRAVAASDPARSLEVLEVIEEAASRTLSDMRSMVGTLRGSEPAELAPRPGVMDLPQLTRAAGELPRVEVALAGDLDDLTPAMDAALYRVAQESITNALRHARRATLVNVRIHGDDEVVRLTVTDDGDASTTEQATWGFGLVGMAERASLLGGSLEAGPGPDRGWSVAVVLPRTGEPA